MKPLTKQLDQSLLRKRWSLLSGRAVTCFYDQKTCTTNSWENNQQNLWLLTGQHPSRITYSSLSTCHCWCDPATTRLQFGSVGKFAKKNILRHPDIPQSHGVIMSQALRRSAISRHWLSRIRRQCGLCACSKWVVIITSFIEANCTSHRLLWKHSKLGQGDPPLFGKNTQILD